MSAVLIPAARRNASVVSPVVRNDRAKGVVVTLDVAEVSSDGFVTLNLEALDPATEGFYTLMQNDIVSKPGHYRYYFGPPPVRERYDRVVYGTLPSLWRVRVIHADGGEYVHEVTYEYVGGE